MSDKTQKHSLSGNDRMYILGAVYAAVSFSVSDTFYSYGMFIVGLVLVALAEYVYVRDASRIHESGNR